MLAHGTGSFGFPKPISLHGSIREPGPVLSNPQIMLSLQMPIKPSPLVSANKAPNEVQALLLALPGVLLAIFQPRLVLLHVVLRMCHVHREPLRPHTS